MNLNFSDKTAIVSGSIAGIGLENRAIHRSNFKAVQHMTANHQVTIDGDTAKCLANVRTQQLLANDPNNTFWTIVGRFAYNLIRFKQVRKSKAVLSAFTGVKQDKLNQFKLNQLSITSYP